MSRKNLEIAFKTFDIDGSGSISANELKEILLNGATVQSNVIDEIIKEVDNNGDGEVDLQEFIDIVNRKISN